MTDDLVAHFRAAGRPIEKWIHYFAVYERLLAPYRGRALTLVEVGVDDGGSLSGWRSYFGASARIVGIDVDPAARRFESDGFEIIIGDQADPEFWARQLALVGPIDVLIDDGGHSSVQQIVTVACAVPHVRDGGIIVVEDTHTAYMPKQYPADGRFGFMQFAQHVVDVLHRRNPYVTDRAPDAAGLSAAIHRVEFVESMVIFHVDRRLCGPSAMFDVGSQAVDSPEQPTGTLRSAAIRAFDAAPGWLRVLLAPARRGLGALLRAATRRSRARQVRQYFR